MAHGSRTHHDVFDSLIEDSCKNLLAQVGMLENCLKVHPHTPDDVKRRAESLSNGVISLVSHCRKGGRALPRKPEEGGQDLPAYSPMTIITSLGYSAPAISLGADAESSTHSSIEDKQGAESKDFEQRSSQDSCSSSSNRKAASAHLKCEDSLESNDKIVGTPSEGRANPLGKLSRSVAKRLSRKSHRLSGNANVGEDAGEDDWASVNDGVPTCMIIDGVLNPNWDGKLLWDMCVMSVVMGDAFIMTYQLAFRFVDQPSRFDMIWLWITTSLFCADIVASFCTGYATIIKDGDVSTTGSLITKKSQIVKHYMGQWFPIDFLSTVPWGVIVGSFADSGGKAAVARSTRLVKIVRFIRFIRLARLAKLSAVHERLEEKMGSFLLANGLELTKAIGTLLFICHVNSCIWWALGNPQGFLGEHVSPPHWTEAISLDDGLPYLEKPHLEQYIFTFYWTLGVMRTMPAEVTPQNPVERFYVLLFMFLAFSVFGISIGRITKCYMSFSHRNAAFNEDMSAVRSQLRNWHTDEPLQKTVKEYLKHLHARHRINSREQPLLNQLPPTVQQRLNVCKWSRYLGQVPAMRPFQYHQSALFFIVKEAVGVRDWSSGSYLVKHGRVAERAFVRIVGVLIIRPSTSQTLQNLLSFDPNEENELGELVHQRVNTVDVETLNTEAECRSSCTVVVAVAAELLEIKKKELFDCFKSHPEIDISSHQPFLGDFEYDDEDLTGAAVDQSLRSSSRRDMNHEGGVQAAVTAAVISS